MLNAPLGVGHVWGAFPVWVWEHKYYGELWVLFLDVQMFCPIISREIIFHLYESVVIYLEIWGIGMNYSIFITFGFIFQSVISIKCTFKV